MLLLQQVYFVALAVMLDCFPRLIRGLVQPYPRPTDDHILVFLVELVELLLHCRYFRCKEIPQVSGNTE